MFVSPNGLTLLLWNVQRHRAGCEAYSILVCVSHMYARARAVYYHTYT